MWPACRYLRDLHVPICILLHPLHTPDSKAMQDASLTGRMHHSLACQALIISTNMSLT